MYTYQIECVSQTPDVWSKTNFSHKVRYQMRAEVIIFLLRYLVEVVSASLLRASGGKSSKMESLMDFGRW